MFVYLKSLLRNTFLPPGGLLILAVVGLLLTRRHQRLGNTLLVIGLGSLWLCSTPVVADGLLRMAERYPALDPSRAVNAQAIVILAGGDVRYAPEYGGPAAAGETLARLIYGAFLAHRTSLPVLITGSPNEALAMQAVLVRDLGVTPRWVENQSRDTFENARFSSRLLRAGGIHRVVVVTSSTHEWRAAHEFTSTGLEVVPAPVGNLVVTPRNLGSYLPNADALLHSYEATYELVGEPVRQVFAALHLRRQQPSS